MRRLLHALALVLITTGSVSAAGWRTVVADQPGGIRVAGLIGTEGDDESRGLVISCAADSDLPPMLTVTSTPSRVFSVRPGDRVSIAFAGVSLSGQIERNDSEMTSAVADAENPGKLLAKMLGADDPMVVILGTGNPLVRLTIPRNGLDVAIRDLSLACGIE